MGFDLYGMNPKINKEPEKYSVYNKYKDMDFKQKWEELDADEELQKQYWREHEDYEENNPGVYFRNNVWWWRPLWQFVCERLDDVLTDEDMERGNYNDGHEITADKAMQIGIDLTCMLEDGRIEAYNDRYKAELDAMPQVDCRVCNGNNHGNRKKRDCKACNQTGLVDDWAKSYPFNVENMRAFADFCLQSGGFTIC